MTAAAPLPVLPFTGWSLREALKTGGFGTAYLAKSDESTSLFVLKQINPPADRNKYAISVAEALFATFVAQLVTHPNLARYEVVYYSSKEIWLATEYLSNGDLRARINRGLTTVAEVVRIAEPISAALDHLHRGGLLHGDIHPGNIMFRADDVPVLIDFTLVYHERAADHVTELADGHPRCMGQPRYLSPGRFDGRDWCRASDLYSLAILQFELLTGGHHPLVEDLATVRDNRWESWSAAHARRTLYNCDRLPASQRRELVSYFESALIKRCFDSANTMLDALCVAASMPLPTVQKTNNLVTEGKVGLSLQGPAGLSSDSVPSIGRGRGANAVVFLVGGAFGVAKKRIGEASQQHRKIRIIPKWAVPPHRASVDPAWQPDLVQCSDQKFDRFLGDEGFLHYRLDDWKYGLQDSELVNEARKHGCVFLMCDAQQIHEQIERRIAIRAIDPGLVVRRVWIMQEESECRKDMAIFLEVTRGLTAEDAELGASRSWSRYKHMRRGFFKEAYRYIPVPFHSSKGPNIASRLLELVDWADSGFAP